MKAINGPLTLIIMDGVGLSTSDAGNAFTLAHTPVLDELMASHAFCPLTAHGRAVGMPSDQDMGNSEVGHNALGAGQIVDQGALLVNNAIQSGSLFNGTVWRELVQFVKQQSGTLHLLGLLSDGNVHAHIDHLEALLRQAKREGLARVRVHVLLDGRDVGETTAHLYLQRLQSLLNDLSDTGHDARIASGGGRMFLTMDRYEAEWAMVERGWRHHVLGEGRQFSSADQALKTLRDEDPGVIDQYLPGFVICDEAGPVGPILDGDGVILFNFRGDRAIEISRAFDEDDSFTEFERERVPNVFYAGMMQYDGDLLIPNRYLVSPPEIRQTLTELLVEADVTQYAISETQKYGHVTYFWNGNRSGKMAPAKEHFVEIPSDLLPFEQRPWMKAAEITDSLIAEIGSGRSKFIRANYANGDMVGHTGNLQATITAMTCLDLELGRLLKAVTKSGGVALITADHGNAEEMFEHAKDGAVVLTAAGIPAVKTSHSLNPVPFILFDPQQQVPFTLRQGAEWGISNIASTIAELLGLPSPKSWRPSLLVKPL